MVAFYCEETGFGHNEIKNADESAFLGQFENCVKAMGCFFVFCFFLSVQHPNLH